MMARAGRGRRRLARETRAGCDQGMVFSDAAQKLIASLGLEPLPHEGGFFRQTWRTDAGSAILFLMTTEGFSALHRITQTELWHFYAGDPVDHVQFNSATGRARVTRLGGDVLGGDCPQLVVPAGEWQGARLAPALPGSGGRGYALVGCTVTPAWDERGFELGNCEGLLQRFPAGADWIRALTR